MKNQSRRATLLQSYLAALDTRQDVKRLEAIREQIQTTQDVEELRAIALPFVQRQIRNQMKMISGEGR